MNIKIHITKTLKCAEAPKRFYINNTPFVTSQCQENIPILSSYWPTHFMMCDPSSPCWPNWVCISTIIFLSWSCSSQWCRTDIQSHLALCITPLLEHFRMDRDRHSGGWLAPYVWPATMLDHLGSFSVEWNFYFNTELEPLNWKCSTNEPSNLYWEYFHTGRQFLINKILCLSSNSNGCCIRKSSICSGKRSP